MLCTIVEDVGVCNVRIDHAMELLQAELGSSILRKRNAIENELCQLQSDTAMRKKITPHIQRLVKESKFARVTRSDTMKNLEAVFGQGIHEYLDQVTSILNEETKRHALEEGKPIPDADYILGENLGKGRYGIVRKAVKKSTEDLVAIKMISAEHMGVDFSRQQLTREIEIMKTLVHENILQLFEVIETPECVYLVLELVDGGELFECFSPPDKIFPESTARSVFQQLIMAMYYCHKQGVAHRDLKPANLLMTYTGVLKVSDFGLSTFQNQSESGKVHDSMRLQTCCGSPKYVAPEVVSTDKGYNGFMADMWSCGVILYLMLAGHAPFEHSTVSGLLKKVIIGKYEMPTTFSEGAKDIITKMLVVLPECRITIPQVLEHDWFQVDFDNHKVEAIRCMAGRLSNHASSKANEIAPTTLVRGGKEPT
eukprot:EG_transcript_9685